MTRPMSRMLIYVGIFFGLVFGWYGVKQLMFMWYMAHYEQPPVTISATTVKAETWQNYITAVGSLAAINGVDLSTDAAGRVQEIHFNSGQFVKKGDVLIVLDTSVEQAALKDNQAKLSLAKINYEREKKLFDKKVSSQAALDTRYAELMEAQAGVDSVLAQIQQKTVTAPFDGRTGIRQVDLGQYISPGTVMVTLQSMHPLYVNMNVPEQYLPELYLNQAVDIAVNFGKGKNVKGTLTAINSKVDPITRNIMLQATIPNEKYVLYPGMFALAKVWLRAKQHLPVVPQTAISYSLSGDFVYIIKNKAKEGKQPDYYAYRQYVKVGEHRDDKVSVVDGIKSGDMVITSGQLKLQNDTHVVIDNSVEL
jgi:membrane fusion protein (multidrug efflux system)